MQNGVLPAAFFVVVSVLVWFFLIKSNLFKNFELWSRIFTRAHILATSDKDGDGYGINRNSRLKAQRENST